MTHTDPAGGRLLVAGPSLGDPNFDRTIVYVLEHAPEGALGVVLNRPTSLDVADVVPLWSTVTGHPHVVFGGGPVEAGAAIGLARVRDAVECTGWSPIDGAIGSVDLGVDPDGIAAGIEVARIFAGYAGWGARQLDDELAGGAWFVVDASDDDIFCTEPEQLWGAVLRREDARHAMASGNPSWN